MEKRKKKTGAARRNSSTTASPVWDEQSLTTCCVYNSVPGKRLRGPNVIRPRSNLEDALEVCDAVDKCTGVVMLGNGTDVPAEYANQFALKSGELVADTDDNTTVLYQKGLCEEKLVCDRQAAADSNTTNGTSSANDTVVNSSCVTHADSRVGPGWFAELAPVGTPCVFGADARDEGSHCVHTDDSFGSFGWCYTKTDKSQWGSCVEACPLIGHFSVLEDRLDALTNMVGDLIKKEATEGILDVAKVTNTSNTSNTSSATALFLERPNDIGADDQQQQQKAVSGTAAPATPAEQHERDPGRDK